MSARDEYPEAAGPTLSAYVRQHAAMCDEIDRLRDATTDLRAEANYFAQALNRRLNEIDDQPAPWPITAAIDNRDLLDVIASDDDIPVYRRNEARQAVVDFDAALSGVDAI